MRKRYDNSRTTRKRKRGGRNSGASGEYQIPPITENPIFQFINGLFKVLESGHVGIDRPVPVEYEIVEVSIPPDMFRKLVLLCHPDKHSNSALSQEVTRWLIDQRNAYAKTKKNSD